MLFSNFFTILVFVGLILPTLAFVVLSSQVEELVKTDVQKEDIVRKGKWIFTTNLLISIVLLGWSCQYALLPQKLIDSSTRSFIVIGILFIIGCLHFAAFVMVADKAPKSAPEFKPLLSMGIPFLFVPVAMALYVYVAGVKRRSVMSYVPNYPSFPVKAPPPPFVAPPMAAPVYSAPQIPLPSSASSYPSPVLSTPPSAPSPMPASNNNNIYRGQPQPQPVVTPPTPQVVNNNKTNTPSSTMMNNLRNSAAYIANNAPGMVGNMVGNTVNALAFSAFS